MANENSAKDAKKCKPLKELKPKKKPVAKKKKKFSLVPEELGVSLSDRQIRFCLLYCETLDALSSYMAVYDCKDNKSASTGVCNLLKNDKVVKFLEYLVSDMRKNPIDVSEAEILNGIKEIAFGEKTNANTRLKALELLSKIKGIGTDKEATSTVINVNIQDNDKSVDIVDVDIVETDFVDIDVD